MKLELYYDGGLLEAAPENGGYEPLRILSDLRRLADEKAIDSRAVDVSGWDPEKIDSVYDNAAVVSSSRRKYRIRKVFGTNRASGVFFARGIPALLVYEEGRPVDVFPHDDPSRGLVTIRDYLDTLLGETSDGKRLAISMDDLRAAIGPIGAATSELVREGRRR